MPLTSKILEIEEIAESLSLDKALFQYVGTFDRESTDNVLLKVDETLNHQDYPTKLKKKVFHITVEIIQNLQKYLDNKVILSKYGKALFLIHGNLEKVMITSGNFILKSDVNSLQSRIELINCLTKDELVHFYRGLLDIGSITSQGGAGLGFVDIAKKSGSKIQYEFKDIDEEYTFYILKISVTN